MTFYNDDIEKRKNEIVLDENFRVIAVFEKGKFETEDKDLIEKLKAKGYKTRMK